MVCQRFLSPFPIIQTSFFTCFICKVILFLSSLPSPFRLIIRAFLKKRKKRAHRWISTCSNAFYSVFISSSCFSMIYSVLLLSHPLLLHSLHTPLISYPEERPAYTPGIFPHQTHSFQPHPTVSFISYLIASDPIGFLL